MKIVVNGQTISCASHPSSYVAIDRVWTTGDVVQIVLPMHNSIEHLPNVPAYIAFLHGPIVLAARAGTEDLAGLVADDSRWGHIPSGKRLPLDKAPIILDDNIANITNELEPVQDQPLTFTVPALKMINPMNVVLEPFYQIHDSRYMMYWMALTKAEYSSYIDSWQWWKKRSWRCKDVR